MLAAVLTIALFVSAPPQSALPRVAASFALRAPRTNFRYSQTVRVRPLCAAEGEEEAGKVREQGRHVLGTLETLCLEVLRHGEAAEEDHFSSHYSRFSNWANEEAVSVLQESLRTVTRAARPGPLASDFDTRFSTPMVVALFAGSYAGARCGSCAFLDTAMA